MRVDLVARRQCFVLAEGRHGGSSPKSARARSRSDSFSPRGRRARSEGGIHMRVDLAGDSRSSSPEG